MSSDSLPDGWARVKFGDVVRNVNENSRDLASDGLNRVVGLDHLDPGSLRLKRWDNLADLPDGTTFTRKFKPAQVLFGKRRAYQRKVAVPDFAGVCSGDILVFEPADKRILAEFLPYLVQSNGFFDHALGTSAGSLSPRTKWADLAKYEFALPPVDEQRRAVELMSAIDRSIQLRQAVPWGEARVALVKALLSEFRAEFPKVSLDDLVLTNAVELGRGKVIPKSDLLKFPGHYPVYSSAQGNNGAIGAYGKYMFDEELITWSVDGGGRLFHRPQHRFSVTNIGGYIRILDKSKVSYFFLYLALSDEWSRIPFDWQFKAHPSVIRRVYRNIPLAPMSEQRRVSEMVSALDDAEEASTTEQAALAQVRSAVLSRLMNEVSCAVR